LEGRRGKKVQNVPIEHMWNGCSEMRERERTILNEDGREIIWMKEIWKRRERIEKERRGDRKKCQCVFGIGRPEGT
jgi:hypothetical protein